LKVTFSEFAKNRQAGFVAQLCLIAARNFKFLTRNHMAIAAVFVNSIGLSLLILSLYWKVGKLPEAEIEQMVIDYLDNPTPEALTYLEEQVAQVLGTFVVNLQGLATMMCTLIFIAGCMNVILQLPLQQGVMKREFANKMYTPTAYYLGRFSSNLIIQVVYPAILVAALFWGIGIETTAANFLRLLSAGCLSIAYMTAQGYLEAILVPDTD
jgi:hypothetical protein